MNDFSYDILDLLNKYHNDEKAALAGETSPQCLYAFSPLRENLFEWVEFEPDARILQIGSDYGSFTGILAERAGEVVVLDPRDENLEVNRIRHEARGNVVFMRGDLREQVRWKNQSDRTAEDIMSRPFDYIVFGGFLSQCRKEEAQELLCEAAEHLKPGGMMLAAAENEMGVRYWMGAEKPENSYLEVEFRGLFHTLMSKWGGSFTMYYPVPDYRYPVAVYSDHYLPETGDVTNISARLDGPGLWFGSEEEAMAKVCQNGMFTKFNNSFLGVWTKAAEPVVQEKGNK